ncbi:uncharacterized protein [Centruroides vittatus]|uniref:uncharacterized protein isoform X2 n=1 Tax=Centruroides vittatus TaxID=120091 RepID=UPI00350F7735
MAHGKKDGFSYIDGIPIKVIEKYRPPRKVMLPITCHIPDLTPLLKEEYDFSLENKVLKWTENYRQEIKEVEEAKRKNMASETEFTKPDILSELKLPDSEEKVMQSAICEKQTDSDIPVNANFVPKWQIHSILEPQQVPCQSNEHFSLPDLFDELTTEGKNLVSSIQEMGFPRGQVARAIKHMGMDSKKVIEHLCQIQQLVEMGHNDNDAEIALHFNEYSIEEAKKFLDLMNQLIGLGFKKNAVIKALVQHGSDQDKVLDALLS